MISRNEKNKLIIIKALLLGLCLFTAYLLKWCRISFNTRPPHNTNKGGIRRVNEYYFIAKKHSTLIIIFFFFFLQNERSGSIKQLILVPGKENKYRKRN